MTTIQMEKDRKDVEKEDLVAIPTGEFLTVAQRIQKGKELREKVPRTDHAIWEPPSDRRDPVEVLLETEKDRLTELLPIRHGRMVQTPLSYLRGAAAMMAYDLSHTPSTGIRVQVCGDAHLGNFGFFATPERNLVFDINDFDETILAPWEWDVKRLAASLFVAGLENKLSEAQCHEVVRICGQSYREVIRQLSAMNVMEMWYIQLTTDLLEASAKDKEGRKMFEKTIKKASKNVTSHVYPRITEMVNGHRKIIDEPPLIFHLMDGKVWPYFEELMNQYRESLGSARRVLFDRYHLEDFVVKVVGVGSVGTRCGLLLFLAEPTDPLLLQLKEAVPSVLEPYVGKSEFEHQGRRVVDGQRTIQSASDIMLGWLTGPAGRHFYIRQLKDMKYAFDYLESDMDKLSRYARLCGGTLAKAHARSGDAAMITGYLGKGDTFDRALASFGQAYAKQNMQDYQAMVEAVKSGRLEASVGK